MEERKNRNYDRRPRQPRRDARPDPETAENLLEGRNALTEALAAGRAIDKVYLAEGNTDRALARLAAMAKQAGAVVVETDRRKLDQLSATGAHQGHRRRRRARLFFRRRHLRPRRGKRGAAAHRPLRRAVRPA